jgi:hypothetical protein
VPHLEDGFKCEITFHDGDINISVYEFQPFSMDGGDSIPQSTFDNVTYHTAAPQSLIKGGAAKVTAAYTPADLDEVMDMINVNQKISWKWPDGWYAQMWGWIRTVTPSQLVIGGRPSLEITIEPSFRNASGVETRPLYGVTTTSA